MSPFGFLYSNSISDCKGTTYVVGVVLRMCLNRRKRTAMVNNPIRANVQGYSPCIYLFLAT